MDKKIAETIVDACNNQGYDADINEGYSGRFMYGKETFGVTVDSMSVLVQSIINESDLFEDLNINELRNDSMGLGIVIY